MKAVLLVTVLAVMLAGCGGSESYSSARTRDCIDQDPSMTVITERQDLDYVMMEADAGAYEVTVLGDEVSLAFSRTAKDAQRMAAALKIFAGAFDAPVDDILEQRGNLVISWDSTPTDNQRDRLDACL